MEGECQDDEIEWKDITYKYKFQNRGIYNFFCKQMLFGLMALIELRWRYQIISKQEYVIILDIVLKFILPCTFSYIQTLLKSNKSQSKIFLDLSLKLFQLDLGRRLY